MKYLIILFVLLSISACNKDKEQDLAGDIIEKTIATAGGDRYKRAIIEFNFRQHSYKSIRNRGEFYLERSIQDSIGLVRDVVSNTGFLRYINDTLVKVEDTMATRYNSSVNSVHYFVHLPYNLNDKAVNKKLLGETTIKGQPYYQIEITFQQDGGGVDHHDEFMYWIHKDHYTIDYLAYKFLVNDGGLRFRAAFNPRVIEGIRFVDYENYSIEDYNTSLEDLPALYEQDQLQWLSTIETRNIKVSLRN